MNEYLKIKINLKIFGPINFSRNLIVDYEKPKDVRFITDGTISELIDHLHTLTDRLGRALQSFEYYDFNIDYKQDK